MSKIIVFEGADGVGKTTQAETVNDVLNRIGYNTKLIKQPSDSYRAKTFDPNVSEYLRIVYMLADYSEKLMEIAQTKYDIIIADRSPFMSIMAYNMQKFTSGDDIFAVEQFIPQYAAHYNSNPVMKESLYLVFNRKTPFIKPNVARDGIYASYDWEYLYDFYDALDDEYNEVPVEKLYGDYDTLPENATKELTTFYILDILREKGII